VYLETSVSQQLQRVRGGRGRPLLKGADLNKRLDELRAVREPLYRQIADLTVSTDNRRVAKVVEVIRHELGRILAQS
jgi:shikimate kinase